MVASDEERYRERQQRLTEILADIAGHAHVVSKDRCPYKNKAGECTAQFRCRNQRPFDGGQNPFLCGHDGTFDYRTAWETRPETYEKTREKLKRIREEAARRRAGGARDAG
jgi:hypothetical protein